MKYSHFMLDLETWDLAPTATIIQIAIVPFTFDGQIGQEFIAQIDPLTSIMLGTTISEDTIDWWKKQPQETQIAVSKGRRSVRTVLEDMNDFVADYALPESKCWSHATFDPQVLMHTCKLANRKSPFTFRNYMDIRTLALLAGNPTIEFEVTHPIHTAWADCINQIKYVVGLNKLVKKLN